MRRKMQSSVTGLPDVMSDGRQPSFRTLKNLNPSEFADPAGSAIAYPCLVPSKPTTSGRNLRLRAAVRSRPGRSNSSIRSRFLCGASYASDIASSASSRLPERRRAYRNTDYTCLRQSSSHFRVKDTFEGRRSEECGCPPCRTRLQRNTLIWWSIHSDSNLLW
jgi:hypothetical protein